MLPQASKRKPAWPRVLGATAIVLGVTVLSLAYHDAAFAVDRSDELTKEGAYRIKGVVQSWDFAAERVTIRDDAGTVSLHWNVTSPRVGAWYVVGVEVHESGLRFATSMSRVVLFRD